MKVTLSLILPKEKREGKQDMCSKIERELCEKLKIELSGLMDDYGVNF